VGLAGTLSRGDRTKWLIRTTFVGCLASGLAILGLSWAGLAGNAAYLSGVVFALGFANGMFSVSAIGLMMATAGTGQKSREGVRMGVWGATQAIAFAVGGFVGAAGLDAARHLFPTATAFFIVFAIEALIFVAAAALSVTLDARVPKNTDGFTGLPDGQLRGVSS
jgi:BCD family chlorophyll transporter-like MFS transporter